MKRTTRPDGNRRLPTQADVAREAGVSTATVSRVLNNRCLVNADAKARVEQAMNSLNYVPHAGARALAMQRSGTLGAIIPTLNNAIFAEGIHAFERTAQALGYTLLLSVSQQDIEHEQALVLKMLERGVDGLLLVGNLHAEAVFERLQMAGVRHVCTWAYDARARMPNIGFDNAQAMYAVVDHLVQLGHRHFGMLAGIVRHNDRARDRIEGVRTRLAHHGLRLPEACIVQTPYSIPESRRAFWDVIDQDISALICGNDVIAYGALFEAQKMGLRIPEDLSITGFDDLSLSAEISPALSTVQVSASVMGETAARNLVAAVEGQDDVASRQVATQLVIRETTGRCQVIPAC